MSGAGKEWAGAGSDTGEEARLARRTGDEERPADAARRALRAAREQEGEHAADGERREAETSSPRGRPGDAARAALRRATAERRSAAGASPDPDSDREPDPAPDPEPAQARDFAATTERPADAAREALRAARTEAERKRSEPGAAVDAGAREAGTQGGAGTPKARPRPKDTRAREVRELLAGAFELPSSGPSRGSSATVARDRGGEPSAAPSRARNAPAEGPPARYPRSMAAPDRDGELRRTFSEFTQRAPDEAYAETWWGNAWVEALEQGALDAARLARGRRYESQGNVDSVTVTPGLVLAYVQGSRPRPYRVQVRLRTFSDDEWDRFLDAAAERPGHIAALLDKQMPQSLAECGVRLLPGPGDLEPHCSCPDSGHPCKHAAAVCYRTARLLDRDPFVLLLLRGRGERQLLDALSRRNAARAARAARERGPAPVSGVRARDALARGALPPLPAPLRPPAHPEQPPVCPGVPGGPDPFALDQLATGAAARAHALLTTGHDPVAELTLWQDAVRLAAARPGSGLTAGTRALYASLATATGRTPGDLARAVAAWRQGGQPALTVLEEPWDPPAGRFDRARPLLLAADLPAFRPWRNRLTHPKGHVQLRLGQDGLWYAYESEPDHDEDWWPRGTPDLDPVGALTGLGAFGEARP